MSPRAGLTTERVVDAAVDIVDRRGLHALTLAAVADTVGVRPPSLYNHVAGLDGLWRELTLRAFAELGQRIQRAAVGKSGDDAVRAIGHAYRGFAVDHPGLYPLTVPTTEVDDEALREAGATIVGTVTAVLAGYGMAEDDALHAARTLRSAVHGFVTLELAGGFGLPLATEDTFAWLLDLLTAGLSVHALAV